MCVQVLDFGIKMKLNDGLMMVAHMHHMINLMIIMARGKSNTYVQSQIMQMLILLHQRKHHLPPWEMLKHSWSTFNEEAGELGFSMLARGVLGDSQRNVHSHLNEIYTLIHTHGDVENDQWADAKARKKKTGWRKRIDADSEAVAATATFMNSLLREIKRNKYMVHEWANLEYKNAKSGGPPPPKIQFVGLGVQLWVADTLPLVKMQLAKCTKFISNWGHEIRQVWPELTNVELLEELDLANVPDPASDADDGMETDDEKDEVWVEQPGEVGSDSDERPLSLLLVGKPAPPMPSGSKQKKKARSHSTLTDSSSDDSDFLSEHVPVSAAPQPFRWDSDVREDSILPVHRSQRAGRGRRKNDEDFPVVRHCQNLDL